jgi:hypothetical protein
MRGRLRKRWIVTVAWAAFVVTSVYLLYRFVDPLPPRHLAIAAGIAGTTYDDVARHYARILARNGVTLEVRNYGTWISARPDAVNLTVPSHL